MAVNVTNLLTVIGKYIKTINTWNGYITTLESQKDEIYAVIDNENIQDLYVDLPSQFEGFKNAVASWISTEIGEVEDILTDEAYILENLPISETNVTAVLNAIFDQMVSDNDTIKASIVTIGGADVDKQTAKFEVCGFAEGAASLFIGRLLDGTSNPSSLVNAHESYNNEESQLAMTGTVYAKVVGSTVGAESLQLFTPGPAQAPYTSDTENAGVGPTITNIESNIIALNNYDFSSWSGDNPTGWTLSGGAAGTAWIDQSTTGNGPLEIRTAGVTVKQQLSGLSRRTMYFVGAVVKTQSATPTNDTDWKLRIENVDGLTIHKNIGTTVVLDTGVDASDTYNYVYGFYSPDDSVNLDDIYFCLEYDAETEADDEGLVIKCAVSTVDYFNGLAFVFWNPWDEDAAISSYYISPLLEGAYASVAVSNGNQGVIQTFFRRAFNIQLPTDGGGTETIADTLAT